ncbi:MAG: hypothetical protein ACXW29_09045, partial [Thermoanaerobaculia bacterium]
MRFKREATDDEHIEQVRCLAGRCYDHGAAHRTILGADEDRGLALWRALRVTFDVAPFGVHVSARKRPEGNETKPLTFLGVANACGLQIVENDPDEVVALGACHGPLGQTGARDPVIPLIGFVTLREEEGVVFVGWQYPMRREAVESERPRNTHDTLHFIWPVDERL